MKLLQEQKTRLGIEFDGDDVPETEILKAAETLAAKNNALQPANLAELEKQAAQAKTLLDAKRAEVTRLAKLAELGASEVELPKVVVMQIENADADLLVELETYYGKKAADKFPASGRSSFESNEEIEAAGGVKQEVKTVPTVGLHA